MNGKSARGERRVGERLQHVAGERPGDGEAHHRQREHLEPIGLPAGRWSRNQREWCDLGRLRAEQEEVVVADPRHGELADDAALRVEHRRQVRCGRSWAAGW